MYKYFKHLMLYHNANGLNGTYSIINFKGIVFKKKIYIYILIN